MLNARKIKDEINVFSGIFSSYMYMSVFAIIVLLQVRLRRHVALHFCASLATMCLSLLSKAYSSRALPVKAMAAAAAKIPDIYNCPAWHVNRVLRLTERQVIIMLTPVRRIFHCEEQNGWEWLYAILTGAGSLLVALATKLVTWCALKSTLKTVKPA